VVLSQVLHFTLFSFSEANEIPNVLEFWTGSSRWPAVGTYNPPLTVTYKHPEDYVHLDKRSESYLTRELPGVITCANCLSIPVGLEKDEFIALMTRAVNFGRLSFSKP